MRKSNQDGKVYRAIPNVFQWTAKRSPRWPSIAKELVWDEEANEKILRLVALDFPD